jgi:hypothetical protein
MIQELRKYRIGGIALFDLILSFVGMILLFLICWYVWFRNLHWWVFVLAAIILTIPTGILFHVIFGSNTTLNNKLGLSNPATTS